MEKNPAIDLECTVVTDLQADESKAPLLHLANKFNWWKFDIKGGYRRRFSVMTDPGLITMVALGSDIEEFFAVPVKWIITAVRQSWRKPCPAQRLSQIYSLFRRT